MASKEKIKVNCAYCNKELEINPCDLKFKNHFCDIKCHKLYVKEESKRNSIKMTCDYCGKPIEKRLSSFKSYKQHFCGKECHDNFQRENAKKLYQEVTCACCGKVFKKLKNSIQEGQNLFFCSRNCNYKFKGTKNEYVIDIENNYAKIIVKSYLNKIETVFIDIEDIDKCKKYLWNIRTLNYVRNDEIGLLHRYIMDCPDDKVVDHINHNPLDNRKSNLRICTMLQNNHNKKRQNDDIGVYKMKNGKYIVRLFYKGKILNLGTYENKEYAIKIRKEYKEGLKIYG